MSKQRQIMIWLLAAIFIVAGINHFVNPRFYVKIMPPYIPYHLQLVYLSGILEILGGLGVLFALTRQWAGYGLIALMIAVFPANIYMAMNPDLFARTAPAWALYVRLPLQFLLIWWIHQTTIAEKRAPDRPLRFFARE